MSNEEWIAATTGPALDWKQATGWQDGDDPVEPAPEPEPEAKPRRRGSKKQETQDVLNAVTGLDITLEDDDAE